jgi:hypothetical protein
MLIKSLNKSQVLESVEFNLNIVDYQAVYESFRGDLPRYDRIDDETGTYYFNFRAALYTTRLAAALKKMGCEVKETFRPIYDKIVLELSAKEFERHRSGYENVAKVTPFRTHYEVSTVDDDGEHNTHGVLVLALPVAGNAKFEEIRQAIINNFSEIHA